MTPPRLDIAKASVEFYHAYRASHEAQPGDLSADGKQTALLASAEEFRSYYAQCEAEAARVYEQIDRSS